MVRENTIALFTADLAEYSGIHGYFHRLARRRRSHLQQLSCTRRGHDGVIGKQVEKLDRGNRRPLVRCQSSPVLAKQLEQSTGDIHTIVGASRTHRR